jgi:hypothetical protein
LQEGSHLLSPFRGARARFRGDPGSRVFSMRKLCCNRTRIALSLAIDSFEVPLWSDESLGAIRLGQRPCGRTNARHFHHAGDGRNPNENRHDVSLCVLVCSALSNIDVMQLVPIRLHAWSNAIQDPHSEPSRRNDVVELTDPCGIVSKGGFNADHSLVAGRAAGRGYRADDHPRDLRPASKRRQNRKNHARKAHGV